MQIIGHRGAAGLAPENTLLAIQKALDARADWVEFDVHTTRDGHLVVIHDPNTLRTSRRYRSVKRTTLNDIQRLHLRDNQIIPTFAEVVQLIGHRAKINVEIKYRGAAREVVHTIERLIAADYDYDHFLVSSFWPRLLTEVHQLNDQIPLSLLHIIPQTFLHVSLPLRAVGFYKYTITPALIARAKERGLMLYAYTVNSPHQAEKLEKLGVDAIVTNYPDRFSPEQK